MSQFRRSAYLLTALVAAVFVGALVWNPPPPPKFVGLEAAEVPTTFGAFQKLRDEEFDEATRKQLVSASLFSRSYSEGDTMPINLSIIGGTDRNALHDPRACLGGAGWDLSALRDVPLPGTNVVAKMCRAENTEQEQKQAMMYLYVVDGNIVTEITQIRVEMAVSALLGKKNRPVYFVRFMQEIPAEVTDDKKIEARMATFAGAVWQRMGARLTGQQEPAARVAAQSGAQP